MSESALVPDGYAFVRTLGHGATGSVLLARQLRLDRLVAIKTLHAGEHDAPGQRRLEREGQAIVALRHPAIVSVFELRQTPRGAALVMEYVPGGDLATRIGSGGLTGAHAAQLIVETADAIGHAHASGVVHRDLKPANVLLATNGHAKIADFGLARLTWSTTAYRTSAAGVAGTPAYLAPEQILDPAHEHPANDAYALAVVAYELLTGRLPFRAHGIAEFIEAHLYAAPVSPLAYAPHLPEPVVAALLGGLAKDPSGRTTPTRLADAVRAVPARAWDAVFATRMPPDVTPSAGAAPQRTVGHAGPALDRPREIVAATTSVSRHAAPNPPSTRRVTPVAVRRVVALGLAVIAGVVAGLLIALVVRSR